MPMCDVNPIAPNEAVISIMPVNVFIITTGLIKPHEVTTFASAFLLLAPTSPFPVPDVAWPSVSV